MGKKIKRKFHISDVDFAHEANIRSVFFKQDKADFINFDPGFSDPFYDDLVSLIEEVYRDTDNKTLVDQQMQLSKIVENNMQNCCDKFNDAKHFIEKAFPHDPLIWETFGFKRFGKARKSRTGMDNFMKTFHAFAKQYSAELIAVNYTQVMIDEIETLQLVLEKSICNHQLY